MSLPDLAVVLEVLLPGRAHSVATLERWTQAAGPRAGALLEILERVSRPLVQQAVVDALSVRQPVRMLVQPESLRVGHGQQTSRVDGAGWVEQNRLWGQAKAAVQLFTSEEGLNTRTHAQAIVEKVLPSLPEAAFGQAKRRRPQVLN